MSWEAVELSDLVEIMHQGINTAADKVNYADIGVPIIQAKHLKSNDIDFYDVKFLGSEDYEKYKSKYIPQKGDLLFSNIGTIGKSVIVGVCEDFMFAWNVFLIRVKHEQLDVSYLKYYFDYLLSINYYDRFLTGGTVKFVNKKTMGAIKLPLPPLEEQKRIATILDKADAIRQKRKQAIALADEFLRSVFLEMFGDPVNNPKGFPLGTIRDLVESANYGTSGKASESEGEYPVLRMGNITYQGSWDFSDLKYIDLTEKELPKYLVHKGDLLFNRTNSRELVGKTAVYEEELPMAFAGYLVRVRANEMGNTYYLSGYLNSGHGKKVLSGMCKSIVGMANINAQELQNIKLLLPPIELQNRYEEIVKAVRSRVSTQIVSLTELNELFSSLSQKAFSGQL
ncbi:restriction endonuclease subunit S [Vibrio sp. B181a]|uniref:restriction endonuclease subunit S n=1 Tax=Vibrio sp. B181a TaxID=2835906 RepID=UPI0025544420|nr:restriction endonuclease subunit S [Vibrio sp. B181a]MDK9771801.1 restriction endonuclease subunit S [Vibrio sp. B181a]